MALLAHRMSRANIDTAPLELEFEFADGSRYRCEVNTLDQAWSQVEQLDKSPGIMNAWRDGLPWFGEWEP